MTENEVIKKQNRKPGSVKANHVKVCCEITQELYDLFEDYRAKKHRKVDRAGIMVEALEKEGEKIRKELESEGL